MTTDKAIHYIREKRPGSVQMNEQIQAARDFENYLKPMRIIYSKTVPTSLDQIANQQSTLDNLVIYSMSFNLNSFLHRQRLFLHGYERKNLKYIPKIVFVCGEQLKQLSKRWQDKDSLDEDVKRKIEQISNEFAKDLLESTRSNDSKKKNGGGYSLSQDFNPNILIAKAFGMNRFPRKVMKKVKKYQV